MKKEKEKGSESMALSTLSKAEPKSSLVTETQLQVSHISSSSSLSSSIASMPDQIASLRVTNESVGRRRFSSGRPLLKAQGSRYEDALREEDQLAKIAFKQRMSSKNVGLEAQNWAEEAFDFFTKVHEKGAKKRGQVRMSLSSSIASRASFRSLEQSILDSDASSDGNADNDDKVEAAAIFGRKRVKDWNIVVQKKVQKRAKSDDQMPLVTNMNHQLMHERVEEMRERRNDDKEIIRERGLRRIAIDLDMDEEMYFGMPVMKNGDYVLKGPVINVELDLLHLKFVHHDLFSLEHHLSKELHLIFEQYSDKIRTQKEMRLDRRLKVLHLAIDDQKLRLKSPPSTKQEGLFMTKRLNSLYEEANRIRIQRDNDEARIREDLLKLLDLWRNLSQIRKQQGFTNTKTTLIIHKERVEEKSDKALFKSEVEQELDELRALHFIKREEMMDEFEQNKMKWMEKHEARKAAHRRLREYERLSAMGEGSVDLEQMAKDEELMAEKEQRKPQPPKDFDEEQQRLKIEERRRARLRPPGESRLGLELKQSSKITLECEDNREQSRRKDLKQRKIFLKIFFNNKQVCKTDLKPIDSDFEVELKHIYPMQVMQTPNSLELHLFESLGTKKEQLLAVVTLPKEEASATLKEADVQQVQFVSDLQRQHDHTGLGSMTPYASTSDGSAVRSDPIKGVISYRLAIKGDNQSINIDNKKSSEQELINYNELTEEQRENLDILMQEESKDDKNYFRLNDNSDQFVLANDDELNRNPRFQLLQLRHLKLIPNYNLIPVDAKEIPKAIIEAVRDKIASSRSQAANNTLSLQVDPLREGSVNKLNELRARLCHSFNLAKHKKRFSDIVHEESSLINARTLAMLFGEFVPPPRPLKPVRIERKRVMPIENQRVNILVAVVRAYDIPLRSDHDPLINAQSSTLSLQNSNNNGFESQISLRNEQGPKEARVNCFVEINFQNQTRRTRASHGPSPAWNEELLLNFKAPNDDFSPDNLDVVQDNIYCHLFDEVVVDLSDAARRVEGQSEVHQRLERHWLGSLCIPFSTLYARTRIEGTFRLNSPPFMLGYDRPINNDRRDFSSPFVNLYITLEPPLSRPESRLERREQLECEEDEEILEICSKFAKNWDKFSHRLIDPIVIDCKGKRVLMNRFIRAISSTNNNGEIANEEFANVDKLIWLVSLLPYVPRNALFPGLPEIWPNCLETLEISSGSELEHALLLNNLLLGLGHKSYLVLGEAWAEGNTAYVMLMEDNGDLCLINAVNAEKFGLNDNFLPLKSVFVVFNEANLWLNIQPTENASNIRWDLSIQGDWAPLFPGGSNARIEQSVQPAVITWQPADARAAKIIRDKLERATRDCLMRERQKLGLRTTINFQGNAVLRKLLPHLENGRNKGQLGPDASRASIANYEGLTDFTRLAAAYHICGFPLHFAFGKGVSEVLQAVRATGVHANGRSDVEFALAVHVEPYVANLMSVWVYVATLTKRR